MLNLSEFSAAFNGGTKLFLAGGYEEVDLETGEGSQ